MTENETAELGQTEGAEGQEEQDYEYPITVEDTGPNAKRITVEIPRERIDEKLKEQFKELRQQAVIPGFRNGHAPQKLIEKRFAADVRDQVRRALINESYNQAVDKNTLQVIGEPDFDNPDAIQLPDEGPLKYSFQVEVQPEITLPDLSNLRVRKHRVQIKDENVDQAMSNLREQQGALVPVEDRGIEPKDYLIADVHIKVDGNVIAHQHDAQLVARPAQLGGFQIDDLPQQLAGAKAGETRTARIKAPDDFPNEQFRGKEVEFEFAIKDIKRLELAEVTPAFLEELGFENEQELREALRQQMQEKLDFDVRQDMREQVNRYLMENVHVQLPEKLSDKQTDRVVGRRAVDLMQRGVPKEVVEANIERLRGAAQDEAARELKLYFILQKLAEQQKVEVTEGELNGRIAMLAAQRGQRPEKLKQQMAKDNTLAQLYLQMCEQQALDKVLANVQVEEVELKPEEQGQAAEAASTPSAAEARGTTPPPAEGGQQEGGQPQG